MQGINWAKLILCCFSQSHVLVVLKILFFVLILAKGFFDLLYGFLLNFRQDQLSTWSQRSFTSFHFIFLGIRPIPLSHIALYSPCWARRQNILLPFLISRVWVQLTEYWRILVSIENVLPLFTQSPNDALSPMNNQAPVSLAKIFFQHVPKRVDPALVTLNRQLRNLKLKPFKRIHFEFDPFHPRVASIR